MSKLQTLSDITGTHSSAVNSNNDKITEAFQNTLSRDGSSPNEMSVDLDMNGNQILNCPNLESFNRDDQTFTGTFTISDTAPILRIVNTTASADYEKWRFRAYTDGGSEYFVLETTDDDDVVQKQPVFLGPRTAAGDITYCGLTAQNFVFYSTTEGSNETILDFGCYDTLAKNNWYTRLVWATDNDALTEKDVYFAWKFYGPSGSYAHTPIAVRWVTNNHNTSLGKSSSSLRPRVYYSSGYQTDITNAEFDDIYEIGWREIPISKYQSAYPFDGSNTYTCESDDSGRFVLHPNGAGSSDTITIPPNSVVPYPIGTVLTFINRDTNSVSISITTDTMYLAGSATTGTRTLAQNGRAEAIKVESTVWIISGTGLT